MDIYISKTTQIQHMYVHVGTRGLSHTQKFGLFVPIVPYSPDSEKELSVVW